MWTAQGKTGWEAGRILGCTERTLNAHVYAAGQKLVAVNRAHLVARAFAHGILRIARVLGLLLAALLLY